MKRYSTLLLLACWLVLLFVVSTVSLHLDSADSIAKAKDDSSSKEILATASN